MNFQKIYESSGNPYDNYPAGVSDADFNERKYPEDDVSDAVRYSEDDAIELVKDIGVTDDKHARFIADVVLGGVEDALADDQPVYADTLINDAFEWVYVTQKDVDVVRKRAETDPDRKKTYERMAKHYEYVAGHNADFLQYADKVFDENDEYRNGAAVDDLFALIEGAYQDGRNVLA